MVHSSSDCDDADAVLINGRRSKNEPVCGEVIVQGGSLGAGWVVEGGWPSSGLRGERMDVVRAVGRRSRAVRRAKEGPQGGMMMVVVLCAVCCAMGGGGESSRSVTEEEAVVELLSVQFLAMTSTAK